MANFIESVDAKLTELLSGWNLITIILCIAIASVLVYPLIVPSEPDTHPFFLGQQSTASPVRQPGESAVYRSNEIQHGYSLRSGLNIKDEGAPKWTMGKDGDLRDIWKRAAGGSGTELEQRGKILSVFGKERVVEHDVQMLSQEINALGRYVRERGGKRVALYLPNCVEFLVAVFGMSHSSSISSIVSKAAFLLKLFHSSFCFLRVEHYFDSVQSA